MLNTFFKLSFFTFLFISFSVISFAVKANTNPQLPVEEFVKHGDYLDMQLSPDGKHIAARVRVNGMVNLVVLETASMKLVGGVRPFENDEIFSAEWINNERIVYQYSEKRFQFDQPIPTGELFAIDFDGDRNTMLFGYRAQEKTTGSRIKKRESTLASAKIISTLPHDDRHILIAEYPFTTDGNRLINDKQRPPSISILNVYNGKKKDGEHIPFAGATPFADDDGNVRFVRYNTEEFKTKAVFRNDNDSPWQDLSELTDSDFIPISLSSDGSTVFLSGNLGNDEINTIYKLDLKTQSITPLFDDLKSDIEFYNWDPALDIPVVGISMPDKMQYHYADIESETVRLHKMLAKAFEGKVASITSQSEDGKLLLLHVRSDINPGEYYLFDTTSMQASFLWANRSWLDPRMMANKTPFSFINDEGMTIHGYVTLPKATKEGEQPPFVTLIHGGPHFVRDYWDFDSEVQLLANRGYAVVQVNFRGSDGYGDTFHRAGYKNWGQGMISDILQGTRATIESFDLNADKACVYGGSYGGYAAMMAAAKAPDMFKCAIGYVGIYDLNYAYEYSDTMRALGGEAYLQRTIGTDKAELDANSPINHVDKIKADVLLIHGEKDSRVPVINAESMLEKFKAPGKDVEYINFKNSGHGVYDEEGRKELYEALVDFLATHLN
uniref:alpha/beta hydrolase family protein n=1 Tax=Ningiella ruwaisensis TaxID=2364274 RepID=UPI00109F328D|nr:alpha/beta fold hydrolase [Ningiella ruwaisensis]